MQLDPQMIAVMKKRAVLASRPDDPAALPIEAVRKAYNAERAWWNAIKPEMGSVSELAVTGPSGISPSGSTVHRMPMRDQRSCTCTVAAGWSAILIPTTV